MSHALALLLAITLTAAPLWAQAQRAEPTAGPAVSTVRVLWQQLTGYITEAADEVSEAQYAYRPTPDVRSFGQLIGHVAGAQYLMCAAALGEPARSEDEIERTRTAKADLLSALRASTEYCARAYAQSDAASQQPTQLFGEERSRLYALALNATHNAEHYGNIVTYLRLNGMIPPSSRRRS